MSNNNIKTWIERAAEVYEEYIIDKDELDYDFDDGVTMCEIASVRKNIQSTI